jgi:hypothetical protein
MIGVLVVLAVLVAIAYRIRPRREVPRKRFEWDHDD